MLRFTQFLTLIFALLAGSLPIQSVRAQSGRLAVAYVDGDTLYGWREDSPNAVSMSKGLDNFTQVRLSPKATQVAYLTKGALWAIHLDRNSYVQPVVTLDALNEGKGHIRFVLDFG